MFLSFDGTDKVGKDTLIAAFHKATGYQYSAINRWSGTSYAYAKFWKRDLDFKSYLLQDLEIMNSGLLIYLEASDAVIARRFFETAEKDIPLDRLQELKAYYEEYLAKTPLFYVRINTDKPIEDCVSQIQAAIELFEHESIVDKVKRLQKAILAFGDDVSGTKELRNIKLEFTDNTEFKGLKSYIHDNNLLLHSEWPEYQVISANIRNIIRLKLDYFKSQDIYSRQFVHHSDSCISFVQILLRNNVLEMIVHMRSCNAVKNLLMDLYALNQIWQVVHSYYARQSAYKMTIYISSAHIFTDENGNPK